MDCGSDTDLAVVAVASLILLRKKRKKKPATWVNPYLAERGTKGRFVTDFADMKFKCTSAFKDNFHMTPAQFDELIVLLSDDLVSKKHSRPDLISPAEKLAITLEFLASGSLQRHIASCYRVSKQRVGEIIESTCAIIFYKLGQEFPQTNKEKDWISHSNKYNMFWQFPNCVGAIDGKHCAIQAPDNGASLFYNHKLFNSVVLMAVADAECKFIFADIGAYGNEGDATIFAQSSFGKSLYSENLNLPKPAMVYGRNLPFVFLADDAFPLHENILKPYKPTKKNPILQPEQKIFNYRLSRARRCSENAFGILCARWQCLARTLFVIPEKAQKIIGAACLLHNFLMRDKDYYCPPGFMDTCNENGTIVQGNFRNSISGNSLFHSGLPTDHNWGRPPATPVEQRYHLTKFFISQHGALPWQKRVLFMKE